MPLPKTWSLDEFFTSKTLEKELSSLRKSLAHFNDVEELQTAKKRLSEVASFVHCLIAQDVRDTKALALQAEVTALGAAFENASDSFIERLSKLSEKAFEKELPKNTAFWFRKQRELCKEKLPVETERLATDLKVDGYHAWHEFYGQLIGKMKIPFGRKTLSCAEADALLCHKERKIRALVFKNWGNTAKASSDLFSQTLNHLVGFRLELNRHRKWPSPLKEPLFQNNMEETSLRSMWKVVSENKAPFVQFLKHKARVLRVPKLAWYDLEAPVSSSKLEIPYETASKIVVESFSAFSDEMGQFAKKALKNGWIDAEKRSTKAPGGFCTNFPKSAVTRIFMTYSNNFQSLLTLAHELGHAYHSHKLFQLPMVAQEYPMALAETASTFAEHLVLDHLLETVPSKEKKNILHNKVETSATFFMDIHARFLFEEAFYEARREKALEADAISKLMIDAQKIGYSHSLQEYNPYFWLTKQHFHFSDLPFYNFPYTVGYLCSLALLKKARENKSGAAKMYNAFLQDTGKMSVEDIVSTHFGYDLSKKQFWQDAIDVAIEDVNDLFN